MQESRVPNKKTQKTQKNQKNPKKPKKTQKNLKKTHRTIFCFWGVECDFFCSKHRKYEFSERSEKNAGSDIFFGGV